jgi:hypothetical protein
MRRLMTIFLVIFSLFLLPALVSTGYWALQERPQSWREADWNSSGLLPPADTIDGAIIHLMAARTGGLKGGLSVHSWIVFKRKGEHGYSRYEKVGWGNPVRRDAYAADARWYSNEPVILKTITGSKAQALIPKIEQAIGDYPKSNPGDYRLWPGPNSNSFIAHILRAVPEMGIILPSTAIGRDFRAGNNIISTAWDGGDFHFSLSGVLGFAMGLKSGIELQFFGLVLGVDVINPGLKIPGFGFIGLMPALSSAGQEGSSSAISNPGPGNE